MPRIIVLDSGPLGQVSHPQATSENLACAQWMQARLADGAVIVIPDIIDFEVRRELLRARKTAGLRRLDALSGQLEYAPIKTAILRDAARLWAIARQTGRLTAPDAALDIDMTLVAQANAFSSRDDVVTATSNVRHLGWFTTAQHWRDIVA